MNMDTSEWFKDKRFRIWIFVRNLYNFYNLIKRSSKVTFVINAKWVSLNITFLLITESGLLQSRAEQTKKKWETYPYHLQQCLYLTRVANTIKYLHCHMKSMSFHAFSPEKKATHGRRVEFGPGQLLMLFFEMLHCEDAWHEVDRIELHSLFCLVWVFQLYLKN